ncbi:MAG: hypothetical protein ACREIT_07045 [Tepidisphaeraceae bacterium]
MSTGGTTAWFTSNTTSPSFHKRRSQNDLR